MKCYTLVKGCIVDDIAVDDDGTIHLGEEGRGRTLTKVPLPPESIVHLEMDKRRLAVVRGNDTSVVLLFRDHSGYRGGWSLEHRGPGGGWLPIAEGRCAQGMAGAMGGGPEYLGVLSQGELHITRHGRLYGEPATLVVRFDKDKNLEAIDQNLEARSENAASAFQDALAKLQGS